MEGVARASGGAPSTKRVSSSGRSKPRAVVGDEAVELAENALERGQQRRLLVEVAHEVLPHLERVAVEEARRRRGRHRCRCRPRARWSRCRGRAAGGPAGGGSPRARGARARSGASRARRAERLAAVTVRRARSGGARTSDAARLGLLDGAAQHVLERGRVGARPRRARLFASMRRMTRLRSARSASLTGAQTAQRRATRRLRSAERHRLGAAADLVHGPHAGGTAAPAGAALERLEPAREQIGQHLEDALGEADAARLVVVEVDGRGELRRPASEPAPASTRA